MALSAGLPDDQVDELWGRHCELCDADSSDYGGRRWKGLVDQALKSPRLQTVRRDDPVVAAARRREREARILEENEYYKHAVSLGQWLQQLRTGAVAPANEHELKLLEYREPYPREDVAAWLMAALKGTEPTPRSHPCAGCELRQAGEIVREERVYRTAQCPKCQSIDKPDRVMPHAPQIGMPRSANDPRPDWQQEDFDR